MRVISGMRRGLKLKTPEGLDTRPTTDRVKESVFNILQTHLPCDRVLDLFAGSGALGIECLSRHCDHCTFVEPNRVAGSVIRDNLKNARLDDRALLLPTEAASYLGTCTDAFDLIFLDPPYNKGFLNPVVALIHERGLLAPGGLIVAESEVGGESITDTVYPVRRTARYGKTVITILQG